MDKPLNIDEYIKNYPAEIQVRLEQLRKTIIHAAPGAEEVISYGMPAFKLQGMLVYFAAQSAHIGFYPTPSGIEKFKTELAGYKSAKGSVQFPSDEPLPLGVITEIVKFRVQENLQKGRKK